MFLNFVESSLHLPTAECAMQCCIIPSEAKFKGVANVVDGPPEFKLSVALRPVCKQQKIALEETLLDITKCPYSISGHLSNLRWASKALIRHYLHYLCCAFNSDLILETSGG